MNKERKIIIVILNWNQPAYTLSCLKSASKLDYRSKEIIVVDNGSTDDSVELIKKEYPEIKILRLTQNYGFAGGMNAGIKNAQPEKPEAIFIVNNDILFKNDCLNILAKRLFSNDKIGAVVPMVYLGKSGSTIGSIGAEINWRLGEPRLIGHQKTDDGQFEAKETGYAPASAVIVRNEAIEKAGLIPENYFMYAEDVEWSLNLQKAGYQIWADPEAQVWHDESVSLGQSSPVKQYYYVRNSLLFLKRNTQGVNKLQVYLGFHWKLKKMAIKLLFTGKLKLLAAVLHGYCDFLIGKTGKLEGRK